MIECATILGLCQCYYGIQGYSDTGVIVCAAVLGSSLDCQCYYGIEGYSDTVVIVCGGPGMIPGLSVLLWHTGIL